MGVYGGTGDRGGCWERVMFMFNGTEFLKYRQVCGNRHVGRVGKCSGLKRRHGK